MKLSTMAALLVAPILIFAEVPGVQNETDDDFIGSLAPSEKDSYVFNLNQLAGEVESLREMGLKGYSEAARWLLKKHAGNSTAEKAQRAETLVKMLDESQFVRQMEPESTIPNDDIETLRQKANKTICMIQKYEESEKEKLKQQAIRLKETRTQPSAYKYNGEILTLDEFVKHGGLELQRTYFGTTIRGIGWKIRAVISGVEAGENGTLKLALDKEIKCDITIPPACKMEPLGEAHYLVQRKQQPTNRMQAVPRVKLEGESIVYMFSDSGEFKIIGAKSKIMRDFFDLRYDENMKDLYPNNRR